MSDLTEHEKRGQVIAAMGLVERNGDCFKINIPILYGGYAFYEVRTNYAHTEKAGMVTCSCLEFAEQSPKDRAFRCEHIYAVKHFILKQKTVV